MIASATVSPGLTQTDYTSEVPPIAGTTAYGVSWSPAPAPKLTITNGAPIGSSTNLAFNVAIGTNPGTYPNFFQAPDYFGLGTSITYSESVYNTASSNITPGGDLIYWKTDFASGTNFSGNCTSPLPPLTKNTVITITVNNQGVATTCTVTQ